MLTKTCCSLFLISVLLFSPKANGDSLPPVILTTAPSGLAVELDFVATPSLPGFTTTVITLIPPAGESITGVDASFSGELNQVNPAGTPTVFQDINFLFGFVGADPLDDSQFLFEPSDLLTFGAFNEESDSSLTGFFTFVEFPGDDVELEIAQLVAPAGSTVELLLNIASEDLASPVSDITTTSIDSSFVVPIVPEPSSAGIACAMVYLVVLRRRSR